MTLLILFDALAYSVGLVNLFLLALLFVRDRDTLYAREFLLMCAFGCIVVVQSLEIANGGALPAWFSPGGAWLAELGLSLMVFALPWYVQNLEPRQLRLTPDRLWLVLAAAVEAAFLFSYAAPRLGLAAAVAPIGLANRAVCFAAIAYTLGLALWSLAAALRGRRRNGGAERPRLEMNATTRAAMRMGLFTLAVLPILLYLDFGGREFAGLRGVTVLPAIFVLWSLLLLKLRVGTILAPASSPAMGCDADALERFAERYQISPRESEVLERLALGQTYDKIADELCISLSTAKTHIGRIYRKTGVSNKVELVYLMQKSTERTTAPRPESPA